MLAIGRMCALSDNLHGKLAQPELLAERVKTIANAASPELLKASLYLLQSSVQTSAEAARLAVDAGALPCLCERLEDADAQTKAAATWVLGAIASHDAALAASVADAGALTPLMLCLKEPSLPLRRVALSCFGSVGLALTLTLTLTLALTLALTRTLTLIRTLTLTLTQTLILTLTLTLILI